ncbi:AbrB/MazE/SpoVT family DNA-binding domain-containing protein [Clostridiaceae bacterium NSJ-31]|uniref:AbrB/MazE/SpoVT family DNA-binding domain-containing protein n=1 Tax=Ligaoa zhengdingensis TaxID=2763658 RepID=A0A926DZB3_9FIRM|nr:AbrB/MazE/SpoVT family DNA-binding domain-containing protein [Ligaoa zhengdingensis]MBC8546866.1 AbrB/MazE/SpoVT family DNA-binding domain-containing protein [Ligaoa zhengdingensis]
MKYHLRKVDELGRVVLPLELRMELNLQAGDCVTMRCENGRIWLEKNRATCWLCGSPENLVELENGASVCMSCAEKILQQAAQTDEQK